MLQTFGHFMDNLALSATDLVRARGAGAAPCGPQHALTVRVPAQIAEDQEFFVGTLREYVMFAESLRTVVRKQEQKQYELEHTEERLRALETELEQLQSGTAAKGFSFKSLKAKFTGPDSPDVRERKIAALEQQIADLKSELSSMRSDNERFVASALDEIQRFQRTKVADFKAVLLDYAKRQATFHRKQLTAWQNLRSVFGGV